MPNGSLIISPLLRSSLCRVERAETPTAGQSLERFLAAAERRALRLAELATGNREDALDIVHGLRNRGAS